MITPAVEARFWAKVDKSAGLFGCWIWTGAYNRTGVNFRKKYRGGESRRPVFAVGTHRAGYVVVYAHRLSLALSDGTPLHERQGLHACHRCDNYRCVNPAHLYWGTAEENRRDRYGSLSE